MKRSKPYIADCPEPKHKFVEITPARAHIILGAFSVCCSEGIDGINLTQKQRKELLINEDGLAEAIADMHPEIAEMYSHIF